jgi:hypothetical protein
MFISHFNQMKSEEIPVSSIRELEARYIRYLRSEIESIRLCCEVESITEESCSNCVTEDDIGLFFVSNDFENMEVTVLSGNIPSVDSCLCQEYLTPSLRVEGDSNPDQSSGLFYDYSGGCIVSSSGVDMNLVSKGSKFMDIYPDAYGVITSSSNYCEYDFRRLIQEFNASEVSFWFHVGKDILYYKCKGIGGKAKIGTCNLLHRGKLECILARLESTGNGLFSRILNGYDQSKKDIIINVDCPPGDTTAYGQTIDELLGRVGILEIYVHPDQFENMAVYPLRPAATILHEACHALIALNVLKAGDPSRCTWLSYNHYFAHYGREDWADECIIARNFIEEQADLLRAYNYEYMSRKNYLGSTWGPYFDSYKDCNDAVNYTQSQMSSWYLEMRDSNPNPFPCIND